MTIECHASYLRNAFQNTHMVIERVAKALEGKDYDTIVGSGISGAILLLKLRDRFKCNVAVVRKANDRSHSAEFVEGTIGERFVIVDDQVASGDTVKHILRQIRKQLHQREGVYDMPKFVGVACYCYSSPFCGIEQWIDSTDDRFVLPELPVEKPRAAFTMPPLETLQARPTMSPEDVAKVDFGPTANEQLAFYNNALTAQSSATAEQIYNDMSKAWRQCYYGSMVVPTPRSPAYPMSQSEVDKLNTHHFGDTSA